MPIVQNVVPLSNPNKVIVNKCSHGGIIASLVTTNDEPDNFKICSERTQITLSYDKNKIKSLGLKSYHMGVHKHSLNFPNSNSVCELKNFLNTIWNVDIDQLVGGKLLLTGGLDTSAKLEFINNLDLQNAQLDDIKKIIQKIIDCGNITEKDIDITSLRKKSLTEFESLLDGEYENYWNKYQITDKKKEKTWQHFFENNNWIFGYGLDYKYLSIFDREMIVGSGGGINNQEKPNVDFLCTFNKFTCLVELKTPEEPIFSSEDYRSGTWKISEKIFLAVSQILEQKSSWQVFANSTKEHLSKDGERELLQKTLDAKSILVVGNLSKELDNETNLQIRKIKENTFELFRRNSRNIEILTYDEIYERAKFIVSNAKKQ